MMTMTTMMTVPPPPQEHSLIVLGGAYNALEGPYKAFKRSFKAPKSL